MATWIGPVVPLGAGDVTHTILGNGGPGAAQGFRGPGPSSVGATGHLPATAQNPHPPPFSLPASLSFPPLACLPLVLLTRPAFLGCKPPLSLGSHSLRTSPGGHPSAPGSSDASPGRGAVERGLRVAGAAGHRHGILNLSKVPAQVGAPDGEGQATLRGPSQGLDLQQGRMMMESSEPTSTLQWGDPTG